MISNEGIRLAPSKQEAHRDISTLSTATTWTPRFVVVYDLTDITAINHSETGACKNHSLEGVLGRWFHATSGIHIRNHSEVYGGFYLVI